MTSKQELVMLCSQHSKTSYKKHSTLSTPSPCPPPSPPPPTLPPSLPAFLTTLHSFISLSHFRLAVHFPSTFLSPHFTRYSSFSGRRSIPPLPVDRPAIRPLVSPSIDAIASPGWGRIGSQMYPEPPCIRPQLDIEFQAG